MRSDVAEETVREIVRLRSVPEHVIPGDSCLDGNPIPLYITDATDLIQVKGKAYDVAGNETNVKCTFPAPFGAYIAATGGASDPPSRSFQGFPFGCSALDSELGDPFGAWGADVQIIKNGTAKNACAFVGQYSSYTNPRGFYVNSVLKFDAGGAFKSEKGMLTYNLTSGSFVGTFKVVARP